MKTIVYPGSFDPITNGHIDIIERAAKLADQVVVLVAQSSGKEGLFTVDQRKEFIKDSLKHVANLKIDAHSGLTVDYLRKNNISVIVRGLRAVVDFEYELSMANMNKKLAPEIETTLMFAKPETYFISSRAVKEIAKHKGDLSGLVPKVVAEALLKRF